MSNVSFEFLSMCWNADDVEPFAFDNTIEVKQDHPLPHLLAWTAMVALRRSGWNESTGGSTATDTTTRTSPER